MLAIEFTFPAGRYHATPWGRHVNEADVAWPPDTWRIFRALIAVWHRKIDASVYPKHRLHELLSELAEAPSPSYQLPLVAVHSHTRHYMPGKGDKKTLVFDAFARVSPDQPLIVGWSDVKLDASAAQTLDALLENLGFLGRTESWVEARRVDWQGTFNCTPSIHSVDGQTGEITGDIVRLLAPQPPAAYSAFRLAKLASANIILNAQLEPIAKLSVKDKKLAVTLPSDWLAGVGVDTSDLQAAGWSSPPCAQTVSYRRPFRALQATAPKVVARRVASRERGLADTARFVLYGKPLPRLEQAVRIGEAHRRAAMGLSRRLLGEDCVPPEISGHGLDPINRHGHAFWLPEDADGDGAIDHLLVYANQGFGSDAIRVFTALQTLRLADAEPLRIMFEGVGPSLRFAGLSKYASHSTVWRSVTPYLHPWHLKRPEQRSPEATFNAVAAQLRREWGLRGEQQPPIEHVVEISNDHAGGHRLEPVHFQRRRSKRGLTQPDMLGRMLELQFAEPVQGPIALGFGCHFGLGIFASV